MKRTELIRHLNAQGCQLLREGGRHSIFWNPSNRKTTALPRHTEVLDSVASRICKGPGHACMGKRRPSPPRQPRPAKTGWDWRQPKPKPPRPQR